MTRLLDRLREAERQRVRDHHGAGVYAWGIFGRDLASAPDWLWEEWREERRAILREGDGIVIDGEATLVRLLDAPPELTSASELNQILTLT